MEIDRALINYLDSYYISRRGRSTVAGDITPAANAVHDLGTSTKKFAEIHVVSLHADSITGGGSIDADTLQGQNGAYYLSRTNHTGTQAPSTIFPQGSGSTLDADLVDGNHASAFLNPRYLVLQLETALVNERVFTPQPGFATNDEGPGGAYTIGPDWAISVTTITPDASGDVGLATKIARQDHAHAIAAAAPANDSVNLAASSEGSSSSFSRADHTHQLDEAITPVWTGAHTFYLGTKLQFRDSAIYLYSEADGNLTVIADTKITFASPDIEAQPVQFFTVTGNTKMTGNLTFNGARQIDTATIADLTIKPQGSLVLDPDTNMVKMNTDVAIQSSNYASQTTGWRISYSGGGDFRYLYADELHAKAFIADLEQALAGGQIIAKSCAPLAADFTAPAAGGNATLVVEAFKGFATFKVFVDGDYVLLRSFNRTGTSLTISNCWGTVVWVSTDAAAYTQTYTFTRSSGGNEGTMGASTVVSTGSLVLDYGTTGNGFIEANAIDGNMAENSPYTQIVTWTTHPNSGKVVRTRMGNLKGITAVTEFGLYAGNGVTSSSKYIRITDQNFEIYNLDFKMFDSGSNTIYINPSSLYFAMGNPIPTGFGTNTGIWFGKDSSVYKFRVGNPSGARLSWDGTDFVLYGGGGNQLLKIWGSGGQSGDMELGEYTASARGILWDESAGQLFVKGSILVGNYGFVLTSGTLHCPFDGVPPINRNYSVNFQSRLGNPMSVAGGCLVGGQGKFGKALMIGETSTNHITNPSFETTSGWTFAGDGTGGAFIQATGQFVYGAHSARVTRGTGSTYARIMSANISVPNNETIHLQAWVRCFFGSGGGGIIIRDVTNSINRANVENTSTSQWQWLTCSWTNTTGSAVNIQAWLRNLGTDGQHVYFDGVQVEIGASKDVTPFFFGDMGNGCSWTGTQYASTSSRLITRLAYTAPSIGDMEDFSVSFWVKVSATAANAQRVVCERRVDGNNYWQMRINGSGNVQSLIYVSGSYVTTSTTALNPEVWYHVVAVITGLRTGTTNVKLYINGSLEDEDTHANGAIDTSSAALRIGSTAGTSQALNGWVDDFILTDIKLSQEDILAIYNSAVPIVVQTNSFESMYISDEGNFARINGDGLFIYQVDTTNVFSVLTTTTPADIGGFTAANLAAGDLIIGHNKSNSSAIWWDASAGEFKFYGNASATVQVKIASDGALTAGGGVVSLNANGMRILGTSGAPSEITWSFFYSGLYRTVGYIAGNYVSGTDGYVYVGAKRASGDPWTYPGVIIQAYDSVNSYDARLWLYTDSTWSGGILVSSSVKEVQWNGVLGFSARDATTVRFGGGSGGETAYTKMFINDYLNGGMTYGLTINQGAADNEILAFKSSDVVHAFNNEAETDTYGIFMKAGALAGGLLIAGFSEQTTGLTLVGAGSTANTARSTSALGYVTLRGVVDSSGSYAADSTANVNLFVVRNHTTTRFLVDGEGDIHMDATSNINAWDDYDDVALLTGFRAQMMPDGAELRRRFADWMEYARPVLSSTGVVTYNEDGHHFVSMKRLHMLQIDAIRQLYERGKSTEEALAGLAERVVYLENTLKTAGIAA